jgi:TonB family protein
MFVQRITPPKLEVPREITPPPVVAKLEPPKEMPLPEPPKPEPPKPEPKVEVGTFSAPAAPAPKPAGNPNRVLETGAFSGSSAMATVKAPIQKVQTGGFGDPNGVPANDKGRDGKLVMAKVGSFDLPQGDGQGNGTGGTHGIKGTVASAGFGNGVAGPGEGDHNGGGRYAAPKTAGFGDYQAPVASDRPRQRAVAQSPTTPVEILAKPTPVYTEEARRLKIEGEVLLQVTFTANGQIKVLNVVRGLGHGLDEAAVTAAQKIRYKPALRDGQPVDSTATLHIVFQIA